MGQAFSILAGTVGIITGGFGLGKGIYDIVHEKQDEQGKKIDRNYESIERNYDRLNENNGLIRAVDGKVDRNFNAIERNFDMLKVNNGLIRMVDGKVDRNYGAIKYVSGQVDRNFNAIERNFNMLNINNGLIRMVDGKVDRNYGAILQVSSKVDRNFDAIKTNLIGILANNREIQKVSYKIDKAVEVLSNGLDRNLNVIKYGFERTFYGLERNLISINRNFEAIKMVESKVDRNLMQIILTFQETQKSLELMKKIINEKFDELKEYIKKTKVEAITSELIIFIDDFVRERNLADELTKEELVVFLEGTHSNGFLNKIQNLDVLHESLHKIINSQFAIPENSNDELAFTTLNLLLMGTANYVSAYFFLIYGNKYMANYYYELKDFEKFNKYTASLSFSIKHFDRVLAGENGLLDKLENVMNNIRSLDFIYEEKRDLDIFKKIIKSFKSDLQNLKSITNFIEQKPLFKLEYDFIKTKINTPINQWKCNHEVSYAIQYRNGTELSQISDWSVPYKISDKACPYLKLQKFSGKGERLIFRKFFNDKPELVGIIKDEAEGEFRDITKDLFKTIFENNDKKLFEMELELLIKDGADINNAFRDDKPLINFLAEENKVHEIFYLNENFGLDLNFKDLNDLQPIHIAAELGYKNLLELLIKRNSDVNSRTNLNWAPFHYACKAGNEEIASFLIEKGSNISLNTQNEFNALHIASSSGKCNMIRFLRKNSKLDVNSISSKGLSPLHLAIMNENLSCVKALLEDNRVIDINIQTKEGKLTPLMLAASIGNLEIVKLLLQNENIDVNCLSLEGWTALHLSIISKKENITLELLKINNIDVHLKGKSNLTALHLAVIKNQDKIVLDLLNKNVQIEGRALSGSTPLHMAVEENNIKIMQLLVDNGAKLNVRQENGNNPLLLAVSKNNLKIVKYLIEKGARIDDENQIGNSPIDIAAFKGYLQIFNYLKEKNADLTNALNLAFYGAQLEIIDLLIEADESILNRKDRHGNSVLHYAALSGTQIVKYLIEKDEKKNFDLNLKNNDGDTIFNLCASIGNYDCVKYLSSIKEIDLNLMNNENYTPILKAADSQNWGLVDFLVTKKVDVKKASKHGNTVLHFACRDNEQEVIDYLEIDANILNEENWSPLSFAARFGHLDLVKYLIGEKNADFKLIDKNKMSILHLATMSGNLKLIKYLKEEKNIQVNLDENLTSCLHLAVKYDYLNIVDYFLEKDGPDVNAIDEFGNTPILLAAKEKSWSSVTFLIEKGANIDILDKERNSILHEIARSGELSILKLLKDKKINLKKRIKNNQGMTCLHISVLNSKFDVTKWFIENDFVIDRDNFGNNLLHYSSKVNDLKATKFLSQLIDSNQENYSRELPCALTEDLNIARYLIEEKNSDYINDLFILAKKSNNLGIMKYLIEDLKLDYNQVDKEGRNILIIAAENNHLNKVKYLVSDLKMDINRKDNFGKTATEYSNQNNHTSIKLYLDEMNNLDDIPTFWSPDYRFDVFKAIKKDNLKLVKYFLDEKKIDPFKIKGYHGKSILHLAAIKGSLKMVKYLINEKNLDPNVKDDFKNLAIHESCYYGHLDVTKFLIEEKNVDLNVKGVNDETPLHKASNRIEIVKYLVSKKADIFVADSDGNHPIHFATSTGCIDVVRYFIEELYLEIELKGRKQETVLLQACYYNQFSVFQYLVSKSANLKAKDIQNHGAIHMASMSGALKIVKYLIQVDPNNLELKGLDNKTAIHETCYHNQIETMKYLIDKNADINAKDNFKDNCIHIATYHRSFDIIKYLVENLKIDIDQKGWNDETALLKASSNDDLMLLKYLISKNANIYARDYRNRGAIHLAIIKGSLEIVKHLIEVENMNINLRAVSQFTPLHYAVYENKLEIVKYLVNKGADRNAKDDEQKTPLDWARSENYKPIAEYLESVSFIANIILMEKKLQRANSSNLTKFFSLIDLKPKIREKLIKEESKSAINSKLEFKSLDFNNSLILLNVLVRKYTNEKFISRRNEELSVLDAKMMALNILESFERVLEETLEKHGIKNDEYLNFDPTSLISEITWHLRNENKLDKISKLLISILEKNYKELENKDQQIKYDLIQNLENVLVKQLSIQNTDQLSSNYSIPVSRTQVQLLDNFRLKIEKN